MEKLGRELHTHVAKVSEMQAGPRSLRIEKGAHSSPAQMMSPTLGNLEPHQMFGWMLGMLEHVEIHISAKCSALCMRGPVSLVCSAASKELDSSA